MYLFLFFLSKFTEILLVLFLPTLSRKKGAYCCREVVVAHHHDFHEGGDAIDWQSEGQSSAPSEAASAKHSQVYSRSADTHSQSVKKVTN